MSKKHLPRMGRGQSSKDGTRSLDKALLRDKTRWDNLDKKKGFRLGPVLQRRSENLHLARRGFVHRHRPAGPTVRAQRVSGVGRNALRRRERRARARG